MDMVTYVTVVFTTDGKKKWDLKYHGDRLDTYYKPIHWSKDERFLFVGLRYEMSGFFNDFYDGSAAYKFDLESGKLTEILNGCDFCLFAMTMTPDDRYLLMIQQVNPEEGTPLVLGYHDQEIADYREVDLGTKYFSGGGFVWSPDGENVLFQVIQWKGDYQYSYSFIRHNIRTRSSTTILTRFDRVLNDGVWGENDIVEYVDGDMNTWLLDMKTFKISQKPVATPTP